MTSVLFSVSMSFLLKNTCMFQSFHSFLYMRTKGRAEEAVKESGLFSFITSDLTCSIFLVSTI